MAVGSAVVLVFKVSCQLRAAYYDYKGRALPVRFYGEEDGRRTTTACLRGRRQPEEAQKYIGIGNLNVRYFSSSYWPVAIAIHSNNNHLLLPRASQRNEGSQ